MSRSIERWRVLIAATLAACVVPLFGAENGSATLRVEVSCTAAGALHLIVVDEAGQEDRRAGKANAVVRVAAGETAVVEFPGLAPGVYGVKAFIDRNGNGSLDAGAFGMPSEPWGMSWKTKKPTLRPPRFSDYSFALEADRTVRFTVE